MKTVFRRIPRDGDTDYVTSEQIRLWIERNLSDMPEDVLIIVQIRDS